MEAARIPSCVQAALLDLARSQKLQGRFYWPYIPGMPENPGQHYVRPTKVELPNDAAAIRGSGTGVEAGRSRHTGCTSQDYQATQRAFNLCWLCNKIGHWICECEEPHTACRGPYCQVRRDHLGFHHQGCPFPKRQVGKRGAGKRKREVDDKFTDRPQDGEDMSIDPVASQYE